MRLRNLFSGVHTDPNTETHRDAFFNPPWDVVSEKCVFWQRKRHICVDGVFNRISFTSSITCALVTLWIRTDNTNNIIIIDMTVER